MKKTIVAAVLVVKCFGAFADDEPIWKRVDYKSPVTRYIDIAHIIKTGNTATMWSMQDFDESVGPHGSNPMGFLSTKFQVQFNCQIDEKRDLYWASFSDHMGQGSIVDGGKAAGKEASWIEVPASMESDREIACHHN